MTFQQKVEHAAKSAKWKLDQQLKINKAQGELSEVKNQIYRAKISLADAALEAKDNKKLTKTSGLIDYCTAVEDLIAALEEKQKEIDILKKERFPDLVPEDLVEVATGGEPEAEGVAQLAAPVDPDVKLCSECGTPVPVRFCPNCGADNG